MHLTRRFLAPIVFLLVGSLSHGAIAQGNKSLLIAEPPHGTGSLPIYIAIRKGFFAADGLNVAMLTTDGGATHTNAVLSGQAFAFIGGPEHNAFAKIHGADLRAVVNINDRCTVYVVAKKGQGPTLGQSMASYMKGKTIAVAPIGSTPYSILQYLLKKWGLDPKTDVTLNEMSTATVLAGMKFGAATVGVTSEPFITRGIHDGVLDPPFLNLPTLMGPYAWTTLNVRLASIKDDPDTVRKLVRGVQRGLKFTQEHRDEAELIAKQEFPTMSEEDLKATLDRSYADQAWSLDGLVSSQSWDTASKIVLDAGILKEPVPYKDVIDMQFAEELKTGANP
jgi:NitT/TauT family transport system substrate-binding protein